MSNKHHYSNKIISLYNKMDTINEQLIIVCRMTKKVFKFNFE